MLRQTIGASALALSVALAGAASAQTQNAQNQQQMQGQSQGKQGDIQVLSAWKYDDLYKQGLRAENLLDADIVGTEGEEIGSVENVILDQSNQIVAIIAQVGGFWDIGDTHVAVPWDRVELGNDGNVMIPITEDNVDEFDMYSENSIVTKMMTQQAQVVDDDLETGPKLWKLTNLVDDFATLRGGAGYGYVEDAIFTRDGALQAVVVEPNRGYGTGPYAYPFYGYGYGWNPGYDTYEMPYGEGDVAEMEPFDFEMMEDDWGEVD